MNFRNKKIIIAYSIVGAMILFISVAFAALASNLNISFGNVTQNALSWNVGFKGSSATATTDGTSNTGLSCGTATITPSTVTISDSTLSKPGDKCTYPLTIQNSGDIAANLSSITATEPTSTSCTKTNNSTMVCGNITYKLITTSGSALTTGITINKQEEYNIQLVVTYSGEELSSTAVTQSNAKFTLTYSQAEDRSGTAPEGVETSTGGSGGGSSTAKCKRATTLHTETCSRTDSYGCRAKNYANGANITYGSLGTSGTLTSGDAFDCDVNGDGTYDAATERFYYVSGLDGDNSSDYATLIYYTNVSAGVPDSLGKSKYSDASYTNTVGPSTSYLQLPTTAQWSNVSLSNQTRQIYAENNATTTAGGALPQFTYTDRAARLLSHKEVNAACGITIGNSLEGELDNCEFLLEHTNYTPDDRGVNADAWWLESPCSSDSYFVWFVNGDLRWVFDDSVLDFDIGVRPAIEVLRTDIDY